MNYQGQTGWRLVTPPAYSAMELDEAKNHLRVDHDEDDDDIQVMIDASIGWIEKRDHLLVAQTWEKLLDGFPCGEAITLTKRPILSVDAIEYVDTDGNTQTWDAAKYQVSLTSDPPRILPAYGESWPATRCQMEAVTVRFTGGYNNSPISIPAQLMSAMKLLIGHLYANREAVIVLQGVVSLELPLGLEQLLDSVIGRARVY